MQIGLPLPTRVSTNVQIVIVSLSHQRAQIVNLFSFPERRADQGTFAPMVFDPVPSPRPGTSPESREVRVLVGGKFIDPPWLSKLLNNMSFSVDPGMIRLTKLFIDGKFARG